MYHLIKHGVTPQTKHTSPAMTTVHIPETIRVRGRRQSRWMNNQGHQALWGACTSTGGSATSGSDESTQRCTTRSVMATTTAANNRLPLVHQRATPTQPTMHQSRWSKASCPNYDRNWLRPGSQRKEARQGWGWTTQQHHLDAQLWPRPRGECWQCWWSPRPRASESDLDLPPKVQVLELLTPRHRGPVETAILQYSLSCGAATISV
jgi:hypothetical protein